MLLHTAWQVIDASIHHAYIELIRKAKRYIYVENQYFLGSAHLWETDNDTPCYNQVPAELALKIVNKIKARHMASCSTARRVA